MKHTHKISSNELNKRRMIYSIPHEEVLILIQNMCQTHIIKHRTELPKGYIILSVHENYERRCFDFLIAHESFDIVENGMKTPHCDNLDLEQKMYKAEPYDQGTEL